MIHGVHKICKHYACTCFVCYQIRVLRMCDHPKDVSSKITLTVRPYSLTHSYNHSLDRYLSFISLVFPEDYDPYERDVA